MPILKSTTNGSTQPGRVDPKRQEPAAEEDGGDDPGDDEHVEVLGEVVRGEAPAAELGVVTADELRVGLGQVERRTVGLGEARGEEDQEAEELGDDVPHTHLCVDDPGERKRTAR